MGQRAVMVLGLLGLATVLPSCNAPPRIDPRAVAAAAPATEQQRLERLKGVSSALQNAPFIPGNSVRLLVDGPETYAAMTQVIRNARVRIDMESYQFDTAAAGLFAEMLLQKLREGVAVHLIYDAWGSQAEQTATFDHLRQGGAAVLEYKPLGAGGRLSLDINRRDHRKLLVVDGSVAITGGVNVSGVYLNAPGSPSNDPDRMAWRDTDIRIEGPVVAQFQHLFEDTWKSEHGPALPPAPLTPGFIRGPVLAQAIDGAPADGHPVIYETLLSAIALASKTVHLTTGFFAPTPEMDHALQDAARRGVDVAIVAPAHSDSNAALAAGRSHYHDLLEAGVKLYERQGVVLHAKTAVVDGVWATVGSSNLDWRSTVLNNEIDAVLFDGAFAATMEALFASDIAASHRITPDQWAHRPMGERLSELWARSVEFLF